MATVGCLAGAPAAAAGTPPATGGAAASGVAASGPASTVPRANRGVVGLALSGIGAHLKPPTSPSYKPYSANCHNLLDPGFSGKCVVALGASGTVAAVVEEETAALGPGARHAPVQERDLVWHRQGRRWSLAEVHTFQISDGRPTLAWADDVERDGDPKLVFVTSSGRPGFGSELDLVEGTGEVTLFRFLGTGFGVVPPAGGLVTYVLGATESKPAGQGYYDQVLIGYSGGSWRVFSEQYVPGPAALAQHRGVFWDPRATPAA